MKCINVKEKHKWTNVIIIIIHYSCDITHVVHSGRLLELDPGSPGNVWASTVVSSHATHLGNV